MFYFVYEINNSVAEKKIIERYSCKGRMNTTEILYFKFPSQNGCQKLSAPKNSSKKPKQKSNRWCRR